MSRIYKIGQWTKILLFFSTAFFIFYLLISPESSIKSARSGALLWFNIVLPSLFPFFISFELLNRSGIIKIVGCFFEPIMKPLFNLPGVCGFTFLAGTTGGYPLGAKLTSSLKASNEISKVEAEHLLTFTNNSGPLFILGAVSTGIFHNYSIGILLLTSHILSSITVGIILRPYNYNKRSSTNEKSISNVNYRFLDRLAKEILKFRKEKINIGLIFIESVKHSIKTMLTIAGLIIFFSVIIEMLSKICVRNINNDIIKSLFYGFFEITTGVNSLQSLISKDLFSSVCIASFIIGFGGLCVHMQVLGIVMSQNISIKPYLVGKLLQGSISFVYSWIFLISTQMVIYKSKPDYLSIWIPLIISIFAIFLIIVFKSRKNQTQ